MSTQFNWSTRRVKAALALAEGHTQQTVAETTGVCRKTICNWLCVPEFSAEVDRLSLMVGLASRSERLRIAARAVRQRVRADGTIDTDRDILDWLKFAQSETDGIKFELTMDQVDEVINQHFNNRFERPVRERPLLLKEANSVDPSILADGPMNLEESVEDST